MNQLNAEKVDALLQEMIDMQRQQLLECAKRLVPQLIEDDLLQPNDFPELETNPHFRYQEGLLIGMLSVQAALKSQ
jgi:hypothetical protein